MEAQQNSKVKVLIIEDDDNIRVEFKCMLERKFGDAVEVFASDDPYQGNLYLHEKLGLKKGDMVLMDDRIPGGIRGANYTAGCG